MLVIFLLPFSSLGSRVAFVSVTLASYAVVNWLLRDVGLGTTVPSAFLLSEPDPPAPAAFARVPYLDCPGGGFPDVPGFWVPEVPGFWALGGFLELMSSLSEESSNESLRADSDSMMMEVWGEGVAAHGSIGGD